MDLRSLLVPFTSILAVVLFVAVAAADGPSDQVATYTILRNDSPIGTQAVRFQNAGERLIVQYRVRIRVDVLFVNAYSYDMDTREDWRNGRLERLTVDTDKNGDALRVRARRSGEALVVHGSEGAVRAPADAVPAGPTWNVLDPHPSRMIDTESGVLKPVQISGPTRVRLRMGGRRVRADRYSVSGGYDSTLWYRSDGVLLRQRTVAEDDSIIDFRLR